MRYTTLLLSELHTWRDAGVIGRNLGFIIIQLIQDSGSAIILR